MLNFKEWLNIQELRVDQDVATQASSSAARNIGRDANHIVVCLLKEIKGWDIELTPHLGVEDTIDKIDGYFTNGPYNGKSVQIIRRISRDSRDDYAIRLTDRYRRDSAIFGKNLRNLIQNSDSKISSAADLFIMLNPGDDKIFISEGSALQNALYRTLDELESDSFNRGALLPERKSFRSTSGVTLNLGRAAAGLAVLAYIPAQPTSLEIITISPQDVKDCTDAHEAKKEAQAEEERRAAMQAQLERDRIEQERRATLKKSDLEIAIDQAKAGGTGTLTLTGNLKAINNKLGNIKKAANLQGLKTSFDARTNIVTLST